MPEIVLDGRRTAYLDEGRGAPAVCFIHAFPLAGAMWRAQIDALSGSHRCLAPDLYGFGASEVPASRRDYSIAGYADQVAAVVEAAETGPLVVVGLSMGGYVALDLGRRRPDLVAALVLADTRAEADGPEARQRRSDQQVFLSGGGDVATLADGLGKALISDRSPAAGAARDAARQWMLATPKEGWIGALEAMRTRPDTTEALTGIDRPALVIVGEDDNVTPLAAAKTLATGISGSRLEVIGSTGHLSAMEHPEAFTGLLLAFLGALAGGPN